MTMTTWLALPRRSDDDDDDDDDKDEDEDDNGKRMGLMTC